MYFMFLALFWNNYCWLMVQIVIEFPTMNPAHCLASNLLHENELLWPHPHKAIEHENFCFIFFVNIKCIYWIIQFCWCLNYIIKSVKLARTYWESDLEKKCSCKQYFSGSWLNKVWNICDEIWHLNIDTIML